jgi:hypothetical protein
MLQYSCIYGTSMNDATTTATASTPSTATSTLTSLNSSLRNNTIAAIPLNMMSKKATALSLSSSSNTNTNTNTNIHTNSNRHEAIQRRHHNYIGDNTSNEVVGLEETVDRIRDSDKVREFILAPNEIPRELLQTKSLHERIKYVYSCLNSLHQSMPSSNNITTTTTKYSRAAGPAEEELANAVSALQATISRNRSPELTDKWLVERSATRDSENDIGFSNGQSSQDPFHNEQVIVSEDIVMNNPTNRQDFDDLDSSNRSGYLASHIESQGLKDFEARLNYVYQCLRKVQAAQVEQASKPLLNVHSGPSQEADAYRVAHEQGSYATAHSRYPLQSRL